MRRFEDVTDAYYAARRGEEGGREELDAELAWVERILEKDPYLGGEEYSLAEPGIWPWIARVERIGGDLSGFPAIRAWMDRLAERPEYRDELEILERVTPLRSSAAR